MENDIRVSRNLIQRFDLSHVSYEFLAVDIESVLSEICIKQREIMASFYQTFSQVAGDEPIPSGDQNSHPLSLFSALQTVAGTPITLRVVLTLGEG